MAAGKRIRTPWKHRWRRFRYTVLPFLFFAGFTIVTARLWVRQVRPTQAVGEVDAVRVPVAANVDGTLAPLEPQDPLGSPPQPQNWIFGDQVARNEVVARLDDTMLLAQAETINARIGEFEEQLDAIDEQARIDQADRDYDHDREQTRLTLQHQGLVLQGLRLDVQINFDKIEDQRLERRLQYMLDANRKKPDVIPVAQQRIDETRLEQAAIQKRIEENTQTREEVERQTAEAAARVEAYPDSAVTARLDQLLDPVRAQINTEEARLQELKVQTRSLIVRSPIAGTVTQVFARPGQNIQRGQPIIEIAANAGGHIMGYLLETKNIRPAPGMSVSIRPRNDVRRKMESVVEHVGPHVVPLPLHLLRDPNRQEWGLPVKIQMPPNLDARPGELMDLTFDPNDRAG